MAGTYIGKYDTTAGSNSTTASNSVSVAEGMLPSNINNALRDIMADVRQWYNTAEWIEYGDGAGTYTPAYASSTSFTIAGVNVTSVYHVGRRVKLVASTPGTIYGSITATSFSTNTTVTVGWDSGSLSDEAITSVHIGAISASNTSLPETTAITGDYTLDVSGDIILDADGDNVTLKAAGTTSLDFVLNGATNVTLDTPGDLILDAGGADVLLKDDGTTFGSLTQSGGELLVKSGSTPTTALTMSGANVTIAGDLTISGDDLTMATNTSGAVLVGDGTNFNPVVVSGDATIATNGALTIANNSIEAAMMADNSIDSDDYVDGSIDTAHIADNQVTLAKMAGLARGKIIYGDASGDPAALAVGSAGTFLKHDGTDVSWANAGVSYQVVVTGATTKVAGRGYFVNTTSSAFTMTLPASPTLGDTVRIIDYAGTFDSNTCTIGRNSQKIAGASADMTVTTERAGLELVFTDSTQGWLLTEL